MDELSEEIWVLWEKEKLKPKLQELLTYVFEVDNGGHLQYFVNQKNLQKKLNF